MPYKYNESCRNGIKKPRYKVTNWHGNRLRQRGDCTIRFTETIAKWRSAKKGLRDWPQEIGIAIETAWFIHPIFYLPLRQAEVLINSLAGIMKADIAIPGFSNISKRSITLPLYILTKAIEVAGRFVSVDASRLRNYGKDEWPLEKHEVPARLSWHKLPLAIDENHQVPACELTTPKVGAPTAIPELLARIGAPFETFIGNGEPISHAILDKQANAQEGHFAAQDSNLYSRAIHNETSLFKPPSNMDAWWAAENEYNLRFWHATLSAHFR